MYALDPFKIYFKHKSAYTQTHALIVRWKKKWFNGVKQTKKCIRKMVKFKKWVPIFYTM